MRPPMQLHLLFLLFLFSTPPVYAADRYFPPKGGTWERVDMHWDPDSVAALSHFLEEKNTKGFLILKEGRIAFEHYYGIFTKDSLWYWASAGKSLTSVLAGVAVEKGYLQVEHPTSLYLGEGWTSLDERDEKKILVRHQLTMTTGLEDSLPPFEHPEFGYIEDTDACLEPLCLKKRTEPGTRWAYHNAPYRLLEYLIPASKIITEGGVYKRDTVALMPEWNQFTDRYLDEIIGSDGLWYNEIYFSTLQDMARFGLLVLNRGVWDGYTVLADSDYWDKMLSPSQDLNRAYGYLWWINGRESFLLPDLQVTFPGSLIPQAPDDMVMALGKNDQKIYVVPSQKLVVVRMGDAAGEGGFSLTEFDRLLWDKISHIAIDTTSVVMKSKKESSGQGVYTSSRVITIDNKKGSEFHWSIVDCRGRVLLNGESRDRRLQVSLSSLPSGVFLFRLNSEEGRSEKLFAM